MPKYIDKEPLVQEIKEFKQAVQSANTDYLTGYLSALSVAQGMIAKQDIADVVQVVRCRECIQNYGLTQQSEEVPYNKNDIVCCFWNTDGLEADDYCSKGQRKENG